MKLQLSFKKDSKITSVFAENFEQVDKLVEEYSKQGYDYQGVEVRSVLK